MRITVNVCRDTLRNRQRRQCALVDIEPPETIDASPDQLDGLMRKEEHQILHRALNALPERERLAIILRDVEGLSTAEVADILQSSESTVRSQISRGRVRLKATIDRLAGGES
jgi:RNA polymerase sigma-70 factor (ECF subfamily)